MNNIEIQKQLEEALRDAQVAYYLHLEVSANPKTEVKTAEALYDHCLLDALISNDVSATPVSFAISSPSTSHRTDFYSRFVRLFKERGAALLLAQCFESLPDLGSPPATDVFPFALS